MHLHDTLRPSLVDQHGTADFPLDAPDVSGLLRQSSFFSVRVGRQTTSHSLSSVKIMEPQALILRDTQSIWVESLRMIIYAASFLTQISSLPSRAVKSFQDGSSAFHVEATVLQVNPQNVHVSRLLENSAAGKRRRLRCARRKSGLGFIPFANATLADSKRSRNRASTT